MSLEMHREKLVQIIEAINARTPLKELDLLEIFGRAGDLQTEYYAPLVRSIEVWEIRETWREALSKNIPCATVKIVDSFKEIKTASRQFGFIVIDCPFLAANDDHWEAFDLFSSLYGWLQPKSYVLMNLFHNPIRYLQLTRPTLLSKYWDGWGPLKRKSWKKARENFFNVKEPIPLEAMVNKYRRLPEAHGFKYSWDITVPHNEAVTYYAQELVAA
jgi:hypothetical protein